MVTLRIVQRFDSRYEREFMELERKFTELEAERPDYPKGGRLQPISAGEPCNTLIWECEFPDIASAYEVLDFFHGDEAHEALLEEQLPYFKGVRIELYENLEFR
jgi:hypothetical protein